MKNCTVIIPIHELNEDVINLLPNALESVIKQTEVEIPSILVVVKKETELLEKINSIVKEIDKDVDIKILENEGKTDYSSQINLGVENIKTDWFVTLSFDDILTQNWFKILKKEMEVNPNVDIYGCLVQEVDENGNFLSFTNEAIWANGFSEKQGYLTNDVLLDYSVFILDGALINKKKFIECGGLKTNIILSFIYEFLLRATANDLKIYYIPKIGYNRFNGRENSLIKNYIDNLTPTEIKFWYGIAKQEFYYKNEREIVLNFSDIEE